MILLKLLIINLVAILVIDLSGFIPSIKRLLSKWLTKDKIATTEFRLRPFDCSYCMTFWSTLLYIIVTGNFTFFNIFLVVMVTHFTDAVRQIMVLVKDLIIKLIDITYEKIIDKNRN